MKLSKNCERCKTHEVAIGLCQKHLNEHTKKYRAIELKSVKHLTVVRNETKRNTWRIYYKSNHGNEYGWTNIFFGQSNDFGYWNRRKLMFETDIYTTSPKFMIEQLGNYLFNDGQRFTYEVID